MSPRYIILRFFAQEIVVESALGAGAAWWVVHCVGWGGGTGLEEDGW